MNVSLYNHNHELKFLARLDREGSISLTVIERGEVFIWLDTRDQTEALRDELNRVLALLDAATPVEGGAA